MVSAWTAEARHGGVVVRRPDGRTERIIQANLEDRSRDHGINLDDAEEALERAGYVSGTWRWQGAFYKAVVVPEAAWRASSRGRRGAQYSDESMAEWYRSREGQAYLRAKGRS